MKFSFFAKNAKKLWLAATLLWLLVIWGHSMMPASLSTSESDSVLAWLTVLLGKMGLNWTPTSFAVRKAGHFTEFFLLGALLSQTLRTTFAAWPLPFDSCAISMGLLAALCDESIQHFVDGRSCQLSDAMIDLSGVVFAVFLLFLLRKIFPRKGKSSPLS